MPLTVTLSELVNAVSDCAQSENEVVATVVHMICSGQVQLRGSMRGAHIDFASAPVATPSA